MKKVTVCTAPHSYCGHILKDCVLETREIPENRERLERIKERLKTVTPGPWGPYSANIPFNAIVTKPAPSLSKHDSERPTYWRVEDAVFVATAVDDMKYLIALLEEQ